ncbi:DUF4333 domain-containing protein [Actinomycetospora sp. OC33-EN08]|uniref:DUF4333 domain-containing protein n=1 Tax=Actinomycetospora aurantiaca TaxID=3129233 RepID=A0ABU8MR77_9PSEU
MTASVTPEPAAPINGVTPGPGPSEAPPPKKSKAGPIAVLVLSIVGVLFSLIQFVGGVGALAGDLFGPGVVESSTVQGEIQSRIVGGVAMCSQDLRAEVGATITCSVLGGPERYDVRATVTAVDGDDVRYDLEQVD